MTKITSCRLEHHGAAASSCRHALTWIPDSKLVYASHAMLNVAERRQLTANEEPVWTVQKTLRSNMVGGDGDQVIITAVSTIQHAPGGSTDKKNTGLVCGFSNGALTAWRKQQPDHDDDGNDENHENWQERMIMPGSGVSVTDVCALEMDNYAIAVAGSSAGAVLYRRNSGVEVLLPTAVNTVYLRVAEDNPEDVLLFLGTAAPRHNKIHVFRFDDTGTQHYVGALSGHEDWITSFDWSNPLLASGSQDFKIRLWRFRTEETDATTRIAQEEEEEEEEPSVPLLGDSDSEEESDNEEEQEGESRMEIVAGGGKVTHVTLDALLIGHEESVTSVRWHPRALYGQEHLLISSSMDRAILLWGMDEEGIWAPLTRVGSAGGILGGSVGSTLLGYCHATVDQSGKYLIGHAYGGSLHTWTLEEEEDSQEVHWKATPCITGHFDGVTDLSWEASRGDYLLTVSNDQTCRLWSNVSCPSQSDLWIELARPQVHGYNLSAVTSVSTAAHKHLMVSGADEKELRVFDAPKTTLSVLQKFATEASPEDGVDRVERAFIPSLGLSNKASAADGAEQDAFDEPTEESSRLPLERDLGAMSLWPETRKLFGHNTELYCLASTMVGDSPLVASSCKARTVEDAAIRLWNVQVGTCAQVLSGGHKSTVATLAFSPNGKYLASSGKDRRLCLWKRQDDGQFALAWAKDSAHKRIVWSVGFCPWDSTVLASGSRDGCIKVWRVQGGDVSGVGELCSFAPHRTEKPNAVTALSFAPVQLDENTALLALGLESGHLEFFRVPLTADAGSPQLLSALSDGLCHIATVTKLAWRPRPVDTGEVSTTLQLASCSMDWGCRIIQVNLER